MFVLCTMLAKKINIIINEKNNNIDKKEKDAEILKRRQIDMDRKKARENKILNNHKNKEEDKRIWKEKY